MALFQEEYLKNIAEQRINGERRYSHQGYTRDSVQKSLLSESKERFNVGNRNFDIFLSHSFSDKDILLGLKTNLESYGYTIYVDWIEDYGMDRINVTADNVYWIKQRMKASKCLLYAASSNSSHSKWMPWETGYMDGFTGKVAIIPVVTSFQTTYKGVEYLGSYPYVDEEKMQDSSVTKLWVTSQEDRSQYVQFDYWINGSDLMHHSR